MKNLLILSACALLALPLSAATKLMEEFIPGYFVYLQVTEGDRITDVYLNAAHIAAVTLEGFGNGKNYEVLVVTAAPAASGNGVRYVLDFPDKAKAQDCVKLILLRISQASAAGGPR